MINTVTLDLYLRRGYAHLVERAKDALTAAGVLEARRHFDVALLDTFAHASYFELDYEHEADNQRCFAAELRPRLGGAVRMPDVHGALTSRKVLTSEWIEGAQLAQSGPERRRQRLGQRRLRRHVLVHGGLKTGGEPHVRRTDLVLRY